MLFFFNDAATTEIYTLSQHDARPIFFGRSRAKDRPMSAGGESPERVEGTGETVGEAKWAALRELERLYPGVDKGSVRSEEHTSELQSRQYIVCRLLLEKKKLPIPSSL